MNPQTPRIRSNPRLQHQLDWHEEILVDLFAGGGGMPTAIHMATGISPHIACNHDSNAISMHEANHPQMRHYQADVFELDPRAAAQGRLVGLLHASPDCTHHSIEVNVSDTLEGSITGSGTIIHVGEPRHKRIDVRGSGRVRQRQC